MRILLNPFLLLFGITLASLADEPVLLDGESNSVSDADAIQIADAALLGIPFGSEDQISVVRTNGAVVVTFLSFLDAVPTNNAASPTVRFYNEVSNANGFGAVCTWNGKCVRLAKISNFLVAYACQKIGVRAFLQDLSQWSGTRNGDSAVVSWDCGVDLANGTKTLVECARWIGNTSWREGDEKLMKLWPNPASADNFAEPDSIVDYDTQFTIPGFLRMEDP